MAVILQEITAINFHLNSKESSWARKISDKRIYAHRLGWQFMTSNLKPKQLWENIIKRKFRLLPHLTSINASLNDLFDSKVNIESRFTFNRESERERKKFPLQLLLETFALGEKKLFEHRNKFRNCQTSHPEWTAARGRPMNYYFSLSRELWLIEFSQVLGSMISLKRDWGSNRAIIILTCLLWCRMHRGVFFSVPLIKQFKVIKSYIYICCRDV
jgi:hypothetical protein